MIENLTIGILPSLIWLSFYLKEDLHPEPKLMVLKTYFLGAISTFFALFYEILAAEFIEKYVFFPDSVSFLAAKYLVFAFIEEFFKFLVVFLFIFDHKEFDEPVDGMIYSIIVGLGFAGAENIFYVLEHSFEGALKISILRFLGAVFLHALCGGILGYFLAKYYFKGKKRIQIGFGLICATLLHFAFNFLIIYFDIAKKLFFTFFLFPSLFFLLFFSAYLVFLFFQRLKISQE